MKIAFHHNPITGKTHVYDSFTGKEVPGVVGLTFVHKAGEPPRITLEVIEIGAGSGDSYCSITAEAECEFVRIDPLTREVIETLGDNLGPAALRDG